MALIIAFAIIISILRIPGQTPLQDPLTEMLKNNNSVIGADPKV